MNNLFNKRAKEVLWEHFKKTANYKKIQKDLGVAETLSSDNIEEYILKRYPYRRIPNTLDKCIVMFIQEL